MRSSLGLMAMLLAIWLLAWGSLSWANVLSGLVVAGGLMVALPDAGGPRLPVIGRCPGPAGAAAGQGPGGGQPGADP